MRKWIVSLSVTGVFLLVSFVAAQDKPVATSEPFCEGPFKPSWDSLKKQFQVPLWYRDAKFGIIAHWGPQCQPEMGDWYAQRMYQPGEDGYKWMFPPGQNAYTFHVKTYGHPSEFGFKDVCHIWKAEKFDPGKLIALYKRAGARYFVAMANHHDNFDNWDSKYQSWNAVKVGPKKDLIGMWATAARDAGLPFGVSVHASRAWEWYQPAHGSDKDGPKAGVPYDGALTLADGKGKWWEGLDPAELYGPHGAARTEKAWKAYCDKYVNRVLDLVTKYKPDLVYFDDAGLPMGDEYGLTIAAHIYNTSAKAHNGVNQAVITSKCLKDEQRKALVLDIERGKSDKIDPVPWQTDTCIGTWHYLRWLYDRKGYKNAQTVVQMLIDIVSKNGNLQLSIPVRGDGSLDDEEIKILEGIAAWMKVNSECIYGTRPFGVCGEGPSLGDKPKGGLGGITDTAGNFGSQDIRFTTKGRLLYAIVMGWPADGKVTIKTLAKGSANYKGQIASVTMLGASGELKFQRTDDGLIVTVPAEKPTDYAYTLKITAGE